jgi:NADH-quinone oxidoreductase subunit L
VLAAEETQKALELSSGWFMENAWLIALIPAIGFALIIGLGKRMPFKGAEVGLTSMAASLVIATGAGIQWIQRTDSAAHSGEEALGGLFTGVRGALRAAEGAEAAPYIEPVVTQWVWWQNSGLEFGLGSHIDGLSVLLLWLVAFISLLVQIFSLDYVRGDRRYTHFFAALTLFSSGMLVMVMSSNMVQLILGWEIMGLCSFLLIGHWWEDAYNSHSALKAFFTVRVGDVGLLIGTAILYFGANDYAVNTLNSNGFDIRAIGAWALSGEGSSWTLLMASITLFIACIGKSGQFPLHTWLPDAMAGPTPVSSLLHSSTMVVAGVFLVARIYPVFWEGFNIANGGLSFIAVIGGITIIVAAVLAFVQDDIKKVLAYSTVSQLGYMMLALGTGAWLPAVFHVFTHAFFKCCLFLCAGSISHSGSHHSFDMKKDMGGLRKKMPVTFGAWIVSTLALTGVMPFAGFWSKDEIIDNVGANGYTVLFWVGLGGAALTAMYMTRATYLTFFGEPRGAAAGEHHDDGGHDEYATEYRETLITPATIDRELVMAGPAPMSLGAAAAHDDHAAAHGDDSAGHGDDGDGHGDDGDGHGDHGPHESGKLITVPIVILAFFALTAGFANPTPLAGDALGLNLGEGVELLKKYVEPRHEPVKIDETAGHAGESIQLIEAGAFLAAEEGGEGESDAYATGCGRSTPEPGTVCYFPKVKHAVPELGKILLSLGVVALGYAAAISFCLAYYRNRSQRLVGLTERSRIARGGYLFLKNKYYLDALYQNVFVYFVSRPLAKATYWFNQHVIDGAVNGVGTGGKKTGDWVYRNIDQKLVDGAVNASGTVASETGHGLQPVQSGKVNQYGALLFGAATVGAIVLVILNVS